MPITPIKRSTHDAATLLGPSSLRDSPRLPSPVIIQIIILCTNPVIYIFIVPHNLFTASAASAPGLGGRSQAEPDAAPDASIRTQRWSTQPQYRRTSSVIATCGLPSSRRGACATSADGCVDKRCWESSRAGWGYTPGWGHRRWPLCRRWRWRRYGARVIKGPRAGFRVESATYRICASARICACAGRECLCARVNGWGERTHV